MVRDMIAWAVRRARGEAQAQRVETFAGQPLFWRFAPIWPDEFRSGEQSFCRPPWWRPFNVLLHGWRVQPPEEFHDHPRWSVTICLLGRIIERTPWGQRTLRPGSIVIRSRKAIHAFEVPPQADRPWTLFIVGRRDYRQNTYAIVPQRLS